MIRLFPAVLLLNLALGCIVGAVTWYSDIHAGLVLYIVWVLLSSGVAAWIDARELTRAMEEEFERIEQPRACGRKIDKHME